MATQGQYTTSSLQHKTAKQRLPEEEHARAEVAGTTSGSGLKASTSSSTQPAELSRLNASYKDRKRGHTAKQMRVTTRRQTGNSGRKDSSRTAETALRTQSVTKVNSRGGSTRSQSGRRRTPGRRSLTSMSPRHSQH